MVNLKVGYLFCFGFRRGFIIQQLYVSQLGNVFFLIFLNQHTYELHQSNRLV